MRMTVRTKWVLRLAGGFAILLALLWYAASYVGVFGRADQHLFYSFYNLTHPYYHHRVHATASWLVSLCDPSRYAVVASLIIAVALARRQARDACAAAVLMVGAGATALVLKHVLPQPGGAFLEIFSPVPYPRFPSGHATAAMALVLALTFVTPARLRHVMAGLGAVFAAAVGYSLVTLGSHFPSDIFGGFLVAGTWSLLTAAALSEFECRRGVAPSRSGPISVREALTAPVVALLGVLALGAIAALSGPEAIVSYMRAHTALIVGTAAIGVLSTAVSTGVLLSVRRDVMH
jgi:membrane-associated phospholipid phosphatase